ncbi:Pvc16 family protein, partial [uncultured Eudoraea sp.]|uniref:Pvc16 family protein n=1 Tax=uncultured Eudoraea sp. TaxID=1035614 RepID=UPI00261687DE
IEGKLPAVSVYLYQVSLDAWGSDGNLSQEIFAEVDEGGEEIEYKRRRRLFVRLDYLLSSWAQTPEDEQILTGLCVRAIMDNRAIDPSVVIGDSFDESESRDDLFIAMSKRLDEGTLARFWGSLSQPVRPAISVWTAVPILPRKRKQITRVEERAINFRDINSPPTAGPERGPAREVLSRDDIEGQ